MEPYLYLVKKPRFRNAIGKFRCSFHTLEIERCRNSNPKTPVAEWVCGRCELIENSKRFFIEYGINACEREYFYKRYFKAVMGLYI